MNATHKSNQPVVITFLLFVTTCFLAFAQLNIAVLLESELSSKNIEVLSVDFMTKEILR